MLMMLLTEALRQIEFSYFPIFHSDDVDVVDKPEVTGRCFAKWIITQTECGVPRFKSLCSRTDLGNVSLLVLPNAADIHFHTSEILGFLAGTEEATGTHG